MSGTSSQGIARVARLDPAHAVPIGPASKTTASGPWVAPWLVMAMLAFSGAGWSQAERQFAADKGCYNCHGNPPRKSAPTFAQLATQYARARGDTAAQAQLADKLRDGSIFSHVDAHERLSEAEALRLIAWIAEGAP